MLPVHMLQSSSRGPVTILRRNRATSAACTFGSAHNAAAGDQQGLQNGDQRTPLPALGAGAIGKGRGRDDGEPAGDLAAAHTGEQALHLQIDAGINECGRQPFGEVLQLVGHLRPGAGGQIQVVQLIDADQLHTGVWAARIKRGKRQPRQHPDADGAVGAGFGCGALTVPSAAAHGAQRGANMHFRCFRRLRAGRLDVTRR